MTKPASTNDTVGLTPQECIKLLVEHRRSWLLSTLVCAVLALAYALVMPRKWEASQALVVRREVNTSSTTRPGKFDDLFEMRTFQETILELAKSRQVIAATIKAVKGKETGEPSDRDIETFRKRLRMTPPGGAEFGKTEVFYFSVKDSSRERAIQSVAELCRQLDRRLRQLRDEQSHSLVTELQQQVDLATRTHEVETHKLAKFETNVGADLGELRMLNASFSGQSDLRQQAIALEAESREANLQVRDAEQLLKTLQEAQRDPEQLVALPNSLLLSQPTLRQLKDGLVAAQLRAARLRGTRTDEHPQVQAAQDAIEKVRKDLRDELQVAVQGVEVELNLSRNRSANLEKQVVALRQRLSRLAELRADYANHVSTVENSRLVLDQARKRLGEVRATQAAARNVSLVNLIDEPETGPNPVGLGRASVLMLGTLGGLALGLGWFFLTVVPTVMPTEKAVVEQPARQAEPPVEVQSETVVAAKAEPRQQPVKEQPATTFTTRKEVSPSVATKVAEIMSAASQKSVNSLPGVTITPLPQPNDASVSLQQ